ncbi:regulator of cell morphogenesis and NO signaling [Daejeonella rubra]|uniref:Regulator of cell morphogenesis and NO signaling n=1 Tax=Daejeonella rubra TaxID=990371 RepID=A0A1G9UGK1_9SPHI|nr:iron-sulfur cluster repair di-iron protein [Daejeonella rubra]SDM59026.1 regulator of cell morphogenesis and NO signaling [Daejeonella rubra]
METLENNFINVTLIEPKLKHPTIFRVFDDLKGGESLTIHNDHDPKPVYYQLLGERGDVFTWEYLKEGPEWWDVKITKRENGQETIGEIAVKDLRKVEVFKKYGIDFCCGGKKTIAEVCAEKNIDATKVQTDLRLIETENRVSKISYNDWNIDFLADYIVNTHHSYVRKYLPELMNYAAKVAQVHGAQHPELLPIQQLVEEINKELTEHLEQEENVLFTYVKKIAEARKSNMPLVKQAKDLSVLIDELEKDHDLVGRALDKIRDLSKDYEIPGDACASYKLLYKMIQEFEDDLHLHIHLENNILFPKAIEMEKV